MARSITNQGLLIQRETTAGTAATSAMRRYLGLRGMMGYEVEKEYFKASGYKIDTGENTLTELGTLSLELIQDFNTFLPLLSGPFGAPTSAATATPTPSTVAYEHVFTINARAADTLATFTAMWGDASRALQATHTAFNGLTIGVARNQLSLDGTAVLRRPTTGTALPTAGVTEVPMIPVRASTYNVFLDTTWAGLGTTKLLELYNTEIDFGDKLTPNWVVNSAVPSFADLMESTDIEHTQSLRVGFDATAESLIADSLNGGMRFVRVECIGPAINATDFYRLRVDTAVRLNPTDVGENDDSPAVVVNFDGRLQVDPTSGNVARVSLINTLPSL